MEKFDYKKYQEWCKEHKVSEGDESSLIAYKKELKDKVNEELKAKKMKELTDIFGRMAKFAGKDVKFDERAASFLEDMICKLVFTVGAGLKILKVAEEIAEEIAKLGE